MKGYMGGLRDPQSQLHVDVKKTTVDCKWEVWSGRGAYHGRFVSAIALC